MSSASGAMTLTAFPVSRLSLGSDKQKARRESFVASVDDATLRSTVASLVNLLFVTHVGFFGDYTAKLADGTDIGRGIGHNRGSRRGHHGGSDRLEKVGNWS